MAAARTGASGGTRSGSSSPCRKPIGSRSSHRDLEVTDNVDAVPSCPARLAARRKYLWVGREGGVTVVDAETLRVAPESRRGPGTRDRLLRRRQTRVRDQRTVRYALVISVPRLALMKTCGPGAPGIAGVLVLGKTVYVADAVDGTIAVVDGRKHELSRASGLRRSIGRALRARDRWGFAISPGGRRAGLRRLHNRIVQTAPAGKRPDR